MKRTTVYDEQPRYIANQRRRRSNRDPFLARIGLVIGGFLLVLPVAMMLRPDSGKTVTTAGLPGAAGVVRLATNVGPGATDVPAGDLVPATVAAAEQPVASNDAQAETITPAEAIATDPPAVVSDPPNAGATVQPATVQAAAKRKSSTTTTGPVASPAPKQKTAPTTTSKPAPATTTKPTPTTTAATTTKPKPAPVTVTTTKPAPTASKPAPTASKPAPTASKPAPTTTKPAPTTTKPAPTTTRPPSSYTVAEVQAIITSVWPADLQAKALAIAWRESNDQPDVRNYCCYGLFQIHFQANQAWLASVGVTDPSQLFDPYTNAHTAYLMYLRSGWAPWGG
jgi:hypothetical protein